MRKLYRDGQDGLGVGITGGSIDESYILDTQVTIVCKVAAFEAPLDRKAYSLIASYNG